jgi:RpiR family transcriptional regulator, carbohydrate utilization regulator
VEKRTVEEVNSAPNNLLLRIRALLPSLHEQEQKVGQYILSNPDEVVRLPIEELAERCRASDTTIFRFCRKVGADGYQDLKIRLAQAMASVRAPTYAVIDDADTLSQVARKAILANVKALEDTLAMLDAPAVDRAARALLGARRVDIYGAGGGAIAALDLQYKLVRLGVRAVPHTDAEMQVVSATLLTPADVAVAISHSGESQDVARALAIAGKAGAQTIAITNHPGSPLATVAQISLHTAAQESLAYGYPLGARVAQVGLIDILYSYMALMRRPEIDQNHARIAEALQKRQG